MTRKQDLQDRLQRAGSWVRASDTLQPNQRHEAFIFLYIALNALYGRRQYEGGRPEVHEDLRLFLDRVDAMHAKDVAAGGSILLGCLSAQRDAIGKLVGDYFLINGLFKDALPSKVKAGAERDRLIAIASLKTSPPRAALELILRRLTVLRNRVMHGCVTHGPVSKGIPSITKALPVIRAVVLALVQMMTTYGHLVKWDPIPYPRVGFEDPSELE